MTVTDLKQSFLAAWPIMAGYLVLGIPCGLLSHTVGLNALEVFLFSYLFYSGAGQYMVPNMWLAGANPLSIIASVSLVNTRQTLYSTALARYCEKASKPAAFLFAATVTDESFGVNLEKFANGDWTVKRATMVNLMSCTSWACANVIGVLVGSLISVPTALASFAMTAIFICLLCMQEVTAKNLVTIFSAIIGVVICKFVGLGSVAILLGAIFGIAVGYAFTTIRGEDK